MTTNFAHRVLMLIPAARQAAIAAWWDANIDPGRGVDTWNVGLSPTGAAPATAYWISAALTEAQLKAIIVKLCQLASVTAPAGWDTFTKQQKLDWLAGNLPTIQANTGIRVARDDGDGAWSDPEAVLAAAGLQRVTP